MAVFTENKGNENIVIGNVKKRRMTVNTSNEAVLFRIFIKNLYANPKGTLIREYVSNAWDAQVEGGNDEDAVIVELKETPDGEIFFTVEDFGIGINPDRALVMSELLNSTKGDDDSQHGMYGLGSKSGLAYTDLVEIHTHSEGKYYHYNMTLDGDGASFDLVYERDIEKDEKESGTKIQILVEGHDFEDFLTEIRSQLGYFDNVYFRVPNFDNNYRIYEGDYFLSNSLYSTSLRHTDVNPSLHVVLGKVRYDIRWESLGVPRIDIPIGVKFKIGELGVTPSREDLLYEEESVTLIRDRIKKSLIEVSKLCMNNMQPYSDPYEFIREKEHAKYVSLPITGVRINTLELTKHYLIDDEFKQAIADSKYIKGLGFNIGIKVGLDSIIPDYEIIKEVKNGKAYTPEKSFVTFNDIFAQNKNLITNTTKMPLNTRKNSYIHEIELFRKSNNDLKPRYYIIRKKKDTKLSLSQYRHALGLTRKKDKVSEWRGKIVQWQTYIEGVININITDYAQFEVPADFDKAQYVNKEKLRKLEGKILVKKARRAEKGDGYVFDKFETTLANLTKYPLVLYGTDDDQHILSGMLEYFKPNTVRAITVPKTKLSQIKHLYNFITMEELVNGTIEEHTKDDYNKQQLSRTRKIIKQYNTELIIREIIRSELHPLFRTDLKQTDILDRISNFLLKCYNTRRLYTPNRKLLQFFIGKFLKDRDQLFKFVKLEDVNTFIEKEMMGNALIEGNYFIEKVDELNNDVQILKECAPVISLFLLTIHSPNGDLLAKHLKKFLRKHYYSKGILLK